MAETEHERELIKESCTMALYVAICLLAALTVATNHDVEHVNVFALIWGTTVGLALAHWFAFRLSARLVGSGTLARRDLEISGAQLGGAAAVGLLGTVTILLMPHSAELESVRIVVAAFIALVGTAVARSSRASWPRAICYGVGTLVLALLIAILKNTLAGH